MKLLIKTSSKENGCPAGCLVLCDEQGNHLPGQVKGKLEYGIHGAPVLTVTFVVDGEKVALVDSQ